MVTNVILVILGTVVSSTCSRALDLEPVGSDIFQLCDIKQAYFLMGPQFMLLWNGVNTHLWRCNELVL